MGIGSFVAALMFVFTLIYAMNKNFTCILFGCLFVFSLSLGSCVKSTDSSGDGNSYFNLDNNTTTYRGNRTNDASLKAITIPCQNNNTFRLYYSDSVATLGMPDSLHIVSYGRAGHLGYRECYIEVTSSTTDTYLSTGFDHKTIAGRGEIYIDAARVQHFTSTPQADSTYITANLAAQ